MLQVLGDDHYKRMRPVTVGVARKTMAMTTEYRSKIVALHRQWWRIAMREKFSIGTNNPKQKKNSVCMWKSNWGRVYSYHEFISEVTFSIQIKKLRYVLDLNIVMNEKSFTQDNEMFEK